MSTIITAAFFFCNFLTPFSVFQSFLIASLAASRSEESPVALTSCPTGYKAYGENLPEGTGYSTESKSNNWIMKPSDKKW